MSKAIQQPQLPSYFYFLITGTLCIRQPKPEEAEAGQEESVLFPTLNVVVKTEKPYFGMQAMADATNGLQFRYRSESKDTTSMVENVVLNSVFPMGLMTEEEYAWRTQADKAEGV